jgi:hypothetical protein
MNVSKSLDMMFLQIFVPKTMVQSHEFEQTRVYDLKIE